MRPNLQPPSWVETASKWYVSVALKQREFGREHVEKRCAWLHDTVQLTGNIFIVGNVFEHLARHNKVKCAVLKLQTVAPERIRLRADRQAICTGTAHPISLNFPGSIFRLQLPE